MTRKSTAHKQGQANIEIVSVEVVYKSGEVDEFNNVTMIDVDTKIGIPRLSVVSSSGVATNINLNYVEKYEIQTGKAETEGEATFEV